MTPALGNADVGFAARVLVAALVAGLVGLVIAAVDDRGSKPPATTLPTQQSISESTTTTATTTASNSGPSTDDQQAKATACVGNGDTVEIKISWVSGAPYTGTVSVERENLGLKIPPTSFGAGKQALDITSLPMNQALKTGDELEVTLSYKTGDPETIMVEIKECP